ncbi:hypothetical protein CL617_00950 [archaeon]|nr:hypothetical protein [archaeon]
MDKFEEIFNRQKKFTEHFFHNKHNKKLSDIVNNKKDLIQWNKEYILSLIVEATEILNEVDWKMHQKRIGETYNDNILEEGIDVMKYLFGLLIINGFSMKDIYEKFIEKSDVVEAKFKQEETMKKIKEKKDSRIVFVDVDGILADWPGRYIEFVNKKYDTNYKTLPAVEKNLKQREMYSIKSDYRLSGVKKNMAVVKGAKALLQELKRAGYFVILLTARPYKKIFRIYSDTLTWLKDNDLYFDAILWDEEKEKYIIQNFDTQQVKFCIDDNIGNVNRLSNKGFKTFLVNNVLMFNDQTEMEKANKGKLNKDVIVTNNTVELIEELKKMKLI